VLAKSSPLAPGEGLVEFPLFFAQRYAPPSEAKLDEQAEKALSALNAAGYWPAPLAQTSHPYRGPAQEKVASGNFATTHVGDNTDTSPFPAPAGTMSISTAEYLRNMNILIEWLASRERSE
jgi:hypothetical protein